MSRTPTTATGTRARRMAGRPTRTRPSAAQLRLRLLIGLLIVAAVAVPARYGWQHMGGQLDQAAVIREDTARLNVLISEAEQARVGQAEFDARLADARTAIPGLEERPDLITAVETAAQNAGVRWASGTPISVSGRTGDEQADEQTDAEAGDAEAGDADGAGDFEGASGSEQQAPGAAASGGLGTVHGLSVRVEGSPGAIVAFLDELRDQPRLITVQSVTLRTGAGNADGGADLVLHYYSRSN